MLFPETRRRGLVVSLFLFAVTPAICEEVFFRGLILRGLLDPVLARHGIGCAAAVRHLPRRRLPPGSHRPAGRHAVGFIAWRSGFAGAVDPGPFPQQRVLVLLARRASTPPRRLARGAKVGTVGCALVARARLGGRSLVARGRGRRSQT